MRLFLLGVLVVTACACPGQEPAAAAIRVKVFYATFRPGCLTLKAADKADASRGATTDVTVLASRRSDERTVAIFGQEGWSRDLVLTLEARERNCEGPVVASQTQEASLPESGVEYITMDLRAEDLDGDGFVTTANGGTDCDDARADVYPGATELCDGADNNCAAGETDAEASVPYYTDADGDGYGDPATQVFTCVPPAGSVTTPFDCDDADASVRPNQPELACDGRDDNCDGSVDETWSAGSVCTAADGCAGVLTCVAGGTSGASCVATQTPRAWYTDSDGDGRAGTRVDSCRQPTGAVSASSDCDESSRFASNGATERCDKLDNSCDGTVDENDVCAGFGWSAQEGGTAAGVEWRAVAAYGFRLTWLAGNGGRLARVSGAVTTQVSGCPGDWRSAWARSSDGRVFLGSADGKLATTQPDGGGCTVVQSPSSASLNGMVGFEAGGGTTVYVVSSDGRILRWAWPQEPVEVTRVAANLRDIHGTRPESLLAVGAEDYDVASPQPRVYRPGADGAWVREELPASVPAGGYLRGVHALTGELAYAVGDAGVVLERTASGWRKVDAPAATGGTVPNLRAVAAYGRGVVYAVTHLGEVRRLDASANAWTTEVTAPRSLYDVGGAEPRDVWAVGDNGTLVRWGN